MTIRVADQRVGGVAHDVPGPVVEVLGGTVVGVVGADVVVGAGGEVDVVGTDVAEVGVVVGGDVEEVVGAADPPGEPAQPASARPATARTSPQAHTRRVRAARASRRLARRDPGDCTCSLQHVDHDRWSHRCRAVSDDEEHGYPASRAVGWPQPGGCSTAGQEDARMSKATGDRAAEVTEVSEVSAEELAGLLGTAHAPALVDVREADEFEAWAIPGARNVPLSSVESQLATVAQNRRVVVVCASGQRSARAVDALRAAGIDAVNLAGGMLAWAALYDTAWLEIGPFAVVQLRRRGKGCLSYVVATDGEAMVVDPSFEIDRYLDVASAEGWKVTRVVDTHLHADHVSGARALAAATGAVLHLSPGDPRRFPFSSLGNGDRLELGRATARVVAAPGHTLGSVVLDLDGGALLTGDTLFVDGVGRPDLADRPREYGEELYRSLHNLLSHWSDDALVLPAHYGDAVEVVPDVPVATRLRDVRAAVPQLGWERERFVSWAATRATVRPPSYVEIVRLNVGETSASSDEVRALELGPNRCSAA